MSVARLKEIEIHGFKIKSNKIKIEMSDNRVSAIYGPNGYGKTTLLNIIYAVFNKNESLLTIENVSKVIIKYIIHEDMKTITVYKDASSNIYIWNEFDESELIDLRLLYITTERGLSSYRRKINQDDINIFFKQNSDINLNINSSYKDIDILVNFLNGKSEEMIMRDIMNKKHVYVQNINMSVIENLLVDYEQQYNRIKVINKIEYENKILQTTLETFKEVSKEVTTINRNKCNHYISEENIEILKELTTVSFKSINGILNEINEINPKKMNKIYSILNDYNNIKIKESKIKENFKLMTNKQLIIDEDRVLIKIKNTYHTLDKLSHGERQLLTFLVFLEYIGKEKNLILIDEPCIALDTDWQEKLLDLFLSISTNASFIITTHSPYISINYRESIKNIDIE